MCLDAFDVEIIEDVELFKVGTTSFDNLIQTFAPGIVLDTDVKIILLLLLGRLK